jgi:hypothetical protein
MSGPRRRTEISTPEKVIGARVRLIVSTEPDGRAPGGFNICYHRRHHQFIFYPKNHTVTQSAFAASCHVWCCRHRLCHFAHGINTPFLTLQFN